MMMQAECLFFAEDYPKAEQAYARSERISSLQIHGYDRCTPHGDRHVLDSHQSGKADSILRRQLHG